MQLLNSIVIQLSTPSNSLDAVIELLKSYCVVHFENISRHSYIAKRYYNNSIVKLMENNDYRIRSLKE